MRLSPIFCQPISWDPTQPTTGNGQRTPRFCPQITQIDTDCADFTN